MGCEGHITVPDYLSRSCNNLRLPLKSAASHVRLSPTKTIFRKSRI